ncbi:MAG: hypothetical protein AAF919_14775 [Pseudomonadota bacterium]
MPISRVRRGGQARGFATTEILVAVAVVALVGTLGFLTLGGRDKTLVQSEAAEIALFLQRARLRATESGRDVLVTYDAEARQLTAGPATHPIGSRIDAQAAPSRIRISPSGENDGMRVDLQRKAERVAVTLDWLTGRVEVVR